MHQQHQMKSWIPPRLLFSLLCALELFVYMDRGAFASNGINDQMVQTLGLSNTEDGALQTAFIVGLLLASPIFAQFAAAATASPADAAVSPFRLIGVGQLIWVLSMLASSAAQGAWSMAAARAFIGVGEASFCSIAPVFIYDFAPDGKAGLWLAIYYTFLPLGFAVGYGYGGLMGRLNCTWRFAFVLEACIMAPFVIFFLLAPPVKLKSKDQDEASQSAPPPQPSALRALTSIFRSSWMCLCRVEYCFLMVASTMYTFVIGALAFWGPKAGKETFDLHGTTTDSAFAVMAAVAGVLGTLSSGAAMYKIQSRKSAMAETFLFMCLAMVAGMTFLLTAMTVQEFHIFLVFMGLSMFCLFLTQAPTYSMSMQVVPPSLRSMACALCTVSVHVFGDGPSPFLVGLLQDRTHDWRKTLSLTSLVLVPGYVTLFVGSLRSKLKQAAIAGGEDSFDRSPMNEEEPLLDGNHRSGEAYDDGAKTA